MATYHVATDGNNADTGGLLDPWADPGYAASQLVSGDICYVKAGTYNLSTTTPGAGGPIKFGALLEVRMIGYETTVTDGCPTGNRPVLHANGFAPTAMVDMEPNFDDPQYIHNFEVNGDGQATSGFAIGRAGSPSTAVGRYACAFNCVARNCDGTYGFGYGPCLQCSAIGCSGIGFSNARTAFCKAEACGTGFSSVGQDYLVCCIADGCTGDGFFGDLQQNLMCVAYNCGGDGFENRYIGQSLNCVAVNNTGYGFNVSRSTGSLINCYDYNNTAGRSGGTPYAEIGGGTLANNPFPNAATGDFTIDSSAAGLVLRNVGIVL